MPTDHRTSLRPQEIPSELKQRRQWVLWRYELRHGKWSKVPKTPGGHNASTANPSTWSDFDTVIAAYERGGFDGIGFVFVAGGGLVGVDLDNCIDDNGNLAPRAQQIVEQLDSYTERSPSGHGVHVILAGQLPPGSTRRRRGPVEMYDSGRYFCTTGDHLDGTRTTIEERTEALAELHSELFAEPAALHRIHSAPDDAAAASDEEIIAAIEANVDVRLLRLWRGDTSDYPSQSEADWALCNDLVLLCGGDRARIDRLFRRSGLMRTKWDELRGEQTYGERTIENAIVGADQASARTPELVNDWKGNKLGKRCDENRTDDEVPLIWEERINIGAIELLAKKGDRRDRLHVTALRDGQPIVSEVIAIASGRSREKLANNITSRTGAGDDFRHEVQEWLLRVLKSYEGWHRAQGKIANKPERQLRRSAALLGVEIERPVRQWSSGQECYLISFDGVPVEITEDELDDFNKLNRKVRPYIKRSLQRLDRHEMFRFMGAVVALAVDKNEQSTEAAETLAWLVEEAVVEPCGSPRVTFEANGGQVNRASLAAVIRHVQPLEPLEPGVETERPETYLAGERGIIGYLWDSEGRLYVRIDALLSFLVHRKHLKVTSADIKRRLGMLGFEAMENSRLHGDSRLWAKMDGRVIKVSVWRSPEGFESHMSAGNEDDEH